MSFARPELLWLALLALPELALGLSRAPAFRASVEALAGPRRRERAGRRFLALSVAGTACGALFVAAAALAMAGPSWGERGTVAERRGLEAAIVLDVSRSMEAADLAPSRLEAAKGLVRSLLRSPAAASGSPNGGLRAAEGSSFSLVAAKGASILLAPMTEDFLSFEDALDYANPDATTAAGTNLESGIRTALASFSGSGAQGRALFLFSDGGELSGQARRAAEEAGAAHVRLVVVGMGGNDPALVPGADGAPLAGPKGPVRSARDEARLRALAAVAGGRYIDGSDAGASGELASELASSRGGGTRIEYERVDRRGLLALFALAFLAAALVCDLLAPKGARR
jgi:Ca-activated chloride channel family protein